MRQMGKRGVRSSKRMKQKVKGSARREVERKRRSEVKRFYFCLFVCLYRRWMETNKQTSSSSSSFAFNSNGALFESGFGVFFFFLFLFVCCHQFTLIVLFIHTSLGFLPFSWFVFPWIFSKSNWSVTLISIWVMKNHSFTSIYMRSKLD